MEPSTDKPFFYINKKRKKINNKATYVKKKYFCSMSIMGYIFTAAICLPMLILPWLGIIAIIKKIKKS